MKLRHGPYPALALASILLSGCAHERARMPELAGQVRVDVTDVAYDHSSGTHYLVLEEKSRHRVLPITIGDEEARAIMFELHGIKPERPLTYELLLKFVRETGNRVDYVIIGDVRDEIYYAKVYLDHGKFVLDSRPSDAIAVAIGADVPIFVADRLFQSASAETLPPPVKTARALGLTVQQLSPELAEYFGVTAGSGVLIADLGGSAQQAGLARGDIVTEVDGAAVGSPADFSRAIANASTRGDSQVALNIERGNLSSVIMLKLHQVNASR